MTTTYIEHTLATLCPASGQEHVTEDERQLLDLYALLVLVKGEETTLEDVHDAWAIWRNRTKPDHPSIKPFDQLAAEVQVLDEPYAQAIRVSAKILSGS